MVVYLYQQTTQTNNDMEITIEQMEQALREINFFVGGLTDAGIEYYYNKMVNEGKVNKRRN